MSRWWQSRSVWMWAVGLGMGLLVGVGMMIGTLATLGRPVANELQFPETLLRASASHSGKTLAMATGYVDEEVEGVYILDYLTGDLQCWVLNPRSAQWGGTFQSNVIADLGVEQGKDPNYVIVTGHAMFQRGAGAATPASCAVYVADANTGNFAAYGLMWNRTLMRGGGFQRGTLTLLGTGKARMLAVRDP